MIGLIIYIFFKRNWRSIPKPSTSEKVNNQHIQPGHRHQRLKNSNDMGQLVREVYNLAMAPKRGSSSSINHCHFKQQL